VLARPLYDVTIKSLLQLLLDENYVRPHRLYLDEYCALDYNDSQRDDRPNADQHHTATATELGLHRLASDNHDSTADALTRAASNRTVLLAASRQV